MKKKLHTPRSIKVFKIESAINGIQASLLTELRYLKDVKQKILDLTNNLDYVVHGIEKELEYLQFDVKEKLKGLKK